MLAVVLACSVIAPPPVAAGSIPAEVITSCYSPCGSGGLDTRGSGYWAQVELNATGYTTTRTWDVTARGALGVATSGKAAVWIMLGHGGAGFITTCTNSTQNPCPWSYIYTDSYAPNINCSSPNVCLVNQNLNAVRLMVFQGCNTGLKASDGLDLYDMAYGDGADATVAFRNEIGFDTNTSTAWDTEFFYRLQIGNDVAEAESVGAFKVQLLNGGNYHGYDSYIGDGGSVVIAPPQWGS
jgi:hypothetical protein